MSVHHSPRVMQDAEDFFIRICGCGVVHLNFGVANITATPETVIAMADTFQEVARTLRKHLECIERGRFYSKSQDPHPTCSISQS